MITSFILAQILGITFLFISLSIILNKNFTQSILEKIVKDPALLWILGFISIMIGTSILAFTNFNGLVNSVLAILGIASLLKGIFLLWVPAKTSKLYTKLIKAKWMIIASGIFTLAVAILLIILGFSLI